MNRVFKTKWSAAHQQYVVTDEHHATKGKSSKSAVALAVSALMLAAGSASAAYMGAASSPRTPPLNPFRLPLPPGRLPNTRRTGVLKPWAPPMRTLWASTAGPLLSA